MKKLALFLALTVPAFGQGTVPPVNIGGSIGITGGLSLAGTITLSSMTDANYTLGSNEWWAGQLIVPSSLTLTATRTITAPSTGGQFYNSLCNHSGGGFAVTFLPGAISVPNGTACVSVVFDATTGNYVQVGSSGGGGTYPAGSGIPTVNGGTSWGPTVPLIPVESYGAVGYTTKTAAISGTDSTSAIQSCLNGALPRQCLLQPLYYKTTSTLSITRSGVGIKGFIANENIDDTTSVPLPSVIIITSASADIIDVTGTSLADAISDNRFEDFGMMRSVAPTGTASGLYLNFTTAATVTRTTSADSVYDYRIHGSGGNAIGQLENNQASFGYEGVSYSTGTYAGFFFDSVDGVSNFSIVGVGNATSNNTSGTTTYGTLIKGAHINDVFLYNNASSTTTYGNYVQYTGSGASDSCADIHIYGSINDSIGISGTYITGLIPACGGLVEINGGWNTTSSGIAVEVNNSTGAVIISNTTDSTQGTAAIYILNSTNVSLVGNQCIFLNAATNCIQLSGSSNNNITGNNVTLNNSNAIGVYLGSTSTRNSITGNSFSGIGLYGIEISDGLSVLNTGMETNSFGASITRNVLLAAGLSGNSTHFYDDTYIQNGSNTTEASYQVTDYLLSLKGLYGYGGAGESTGEPKDGKVFLQGDNTDICEYSLVTDSTCAIQISATDDSVGIGGPPVPIAGGTLGRALSIVAGGYAQEYFKTTVPLLANQNVWRLISRSSGDMELQAMSDDNTVEKSAIQFNKTGDTPTSIETLVPLRLIQPLQFETAIGGSPDTGLSRDSADVVDCGNGTAADKSCTFKAATGTFGTALTVAGNNVCQSTGTNCPSTTNSHNDTATIQSALFSTNTILGPVFYEPVAVTYKSIIARLSGSISCSIAPAVSLYDLGTSPSTTFGSVVGTVDGVTTGTSDGVYQHTASVNMVAGHYYGYGFSSGTCATAPTFDLSSAVQ
jgi:hypothetical protein